MASAGSSGRSFVFVSDDVLSSNLQDSSNGNRSDHLSKDLHASRLGTPLVNVYEQQETYPNEVVMSVVGKCMKKYTDNLLHVLEGISGRLFQLELHCHKLERSVLEFRSDMVQDQKETGRKLNSIEKHLEEVHRSVQIIRDKGELAEIQKELVKLQPGNKESNASPVPQLKTHDNPPDAPNHQLALVPRQATALPPPKEPTIQQPTPTSVSSQYLFNQAVFDPQHRQALPQNQQKKPGLEFVQPKPEARQDQPPALLQPPFQYRQLSQFPQLQKQILPQTPPTYPPYLPHQPTNQVPDSVNFGCGSSCSGIPQPLPHHSIQRQPQRQEIQSSFVPYGNNDGFSGSECYLSQQHGYNAAYGIEGFHNAQPLNFQNQNQHLPTGNCGSIAQQLIRDHPNGEMIEKAMNMGYPMRKVLGVIHTMGETGQPIDFNSFLDSLNDHSGGASQRGWSG